MFIFYIDKNLNLKNISVSFILFKSFVKENSIGE